MKNTIQYKRRLNTLFRTSRLYSSDSQEEISRIYANLTCNIPQLTLYQYRRCSNHSFNAFSQNQLTLVNPLCFNDSFDALPYCDENQIRLSFKNLTEEKIRSFITLVRDESSRKELASSIGDIAVGLLQKLAAIPTEELEKNLYPKLSNLQEVGLSQTLQIVREIILNLRKSIRIRCLSETYRSPIMWGHYADSGKGFCVKYNLPNWMNTPFCTKDRVICRNYPNFTCQFYRFISLFPVLYSSKRYDCTHVVESQFQNFVAQCCNMKYNLTQYDFLDHFKVSLYKAAEWKYEKEWRLILSRLDSTVPDFIPITLPATEAVYLGPAISSEDATRLMDYAKKLRTSKGKPVPVYQMNVSWSSHNYKFTPQLIR